MRIQTKIILAIVVITGIIGILFLLFSLTDDRKTPERLGYAYIKAVQKQDLEKLSSIALDESRMRQLARFNASIYDGTSLSDIKVIYAKSDITSNGGNIFIIAKGIRQNGDIIGIVDRLQVEKKVSYLLGLPGFPAYVAWYIGMGRPTEPSVKIVPWPVDERTALPEWVWKR